MRLFKGFLCILAMLCAQQAVAQPLQPQYPKKPIRVLVGTPDRKSTRLNSSHT